MAKLPVNFVLYALYAASAALVGGIGYTFYSTYKLKERFGDVALRKQISADVDKLVKAGRDAQPERKNWRYDPDSLPWWKQFSTVNVTGKLPPKPEETTAPVEPEKPADTGVKIDDILVIESLLVEVGESSDQLSHIVVRYKPGVEVRPPAALVAAADGSRPASWTPGDARPAGGPAAGGAPIPMPTTPGGELRQFVHLEEALWPPYDNIRLVEIAEDAHSATFLREDPKKDRSEWKKETVYKAALDLDPAVVAQLVEGLRRDRAAREQGANGAAVQPEVVPVPRVQETEWRDVPQTMQVAPGQFHVSRRDHDYVRDNIDRVFNDEVGVSTFRSRVGNVEGLRIDRISPRLAQFGLEPGDIVLSINGEKVRQKQQVYTIAKRQYQSGVRRFTVEIMSGRGTGVETRTYTVPRD